jgi:hypothetical protein
MRGFLKFRWSILSLVVTEGTALGTLTVVQHLYRRGLWQPEPPIGIEVGIAGAMAVIVSFVLAIVAIATEKPQAAGIVALCLSVLSFLLYVR